MNVYNWPIDEISEFKNSKTVLVLGAFESLHLGHYELFKAAKNLKAQNPDLRIASLLFKQKNTQKDWKKLFQLKTRIYTLSNLGVQDTIVIEFNETFKNMSPQMFIDHLKSLNVSDIVVGPDFRFGFNRMGNLNDLKNNFNVVVVKEKKYNDLKISTSVIKELVREGNIEAANQVLIENYAFISSIKDYAVTFPGNIIQIPNAIYFVNVVYRDIEYHAILHINSEDSNRIIFLDLPNDILYFDEAFIEILKVHRKINHIAENKVFKSDTKQAFVFFKNSV